MGWDITLRTEEPLNELVLQEAIDLLPEELREGFGNGKQAWGWSLAVDVRLINSKEIHLSGSYSASGKIADFFAEALARRLEHMGYHIITPGIAPKLPTPSFYAYGIDALNSPQFVEANDRAEWMMVTYENSKFLHYWIDQNFQYGEEVRDHCRMPENFIKDPHNIVELRGPRHFTINQR